jgi:uncharacterized membrane protein
VSSKGLGGRTGFWSRASAALWAGGVAAAATVAIARGRTVRRPPGVARGRRGVSADAQVTIKAPADRLFALWARLPELPRVLRHLAVVERLDGDRYRFQVTGPGGAPLAWQAGVTRYVPGSLLAWRSSVDSPVEQEATVSFHPVGEATVLRVELHYRARVAAVEETVRRLLGAQPERDLGADLLRVKLLVEAGKLAA